MNSLETFGFKRKTAENSTESIIQANWDLFYKENSNKSRVSESKSTEFKQINTEIMEIDQIFEGGTRISIENNEIHINSAGTKFNWLQFPHLVKLIHNSVVKHDFNYRKAAEFCNFQYSVLFLDTAIPPSTIQGWYIDNPELKSECNSINFNANFQNLPRKILKPSIFALIFWKFR